MAFDGIIALMNEKRRMHTDQIKQSLTDNKKIIEREKQNAYSKMEKLTKMIEELKQFALVMPSRFYEEVYQFLCEKHLQSKKLSTIPKPKLDFSVATFKDTLKINDLGSIEYVPKTSVDLEKVNVMNLLEKKYSPKREKIDLYENRKDQTCREVLSRQECHSKHTWICKHCFTNNKGKDPCRNCKKPRNKAEKNETMWDLSKKVPHSQTTRSKNHFALNSFLPNAENCKDSPLEKQDLNYTTTMPIKTERIQEKENAKSRLDSKAHYGPKGQFTEREKMAEETIEKRMEATQRLNVETKKQVNKSAIANELTERSPSNSRMNNKHLAICDPDQQRDHSKFMQISQKTAKNRPRKHHRKSYVSK